MEWIGRVRCEKSRSHFVARTFALIATVQTVLHRVSCSYETILNASKHYATHQNMSLWSNRVDWVRSLRKVPTWLHGMNICINCISSHCFVKSFMQLRTIPNGPKHNATHQNMSLGSNGVDWVRSLRKILTWLRGTLFFIEFHAVTKRSKCTKTWVYYPIEWIGCGHCENSRRDFMARTFALFALVHIVL
jgi:hypothetical protein